MQRFRTLLLITACAAGLVAAAPVTLPNFPDFGFFPPATSRPEPIRAFRLSQDYPVDKPAPDAGVQRILAIDYTKDWRAYAEAVKAYAFEGNIKGGNPDNDFFLEDNQVRRWYHVPWQHYGVFGREGLHGMTNEIGIVPQTLAPTQVTKWQTYAVGFYNAPGGWAIGRMWADPRNPRLNALATDGGFPVGTVVAKMLFTTATVSEVPYLSNPVQWFGYVMTAPYASGKPPPPRLIQQLRLVQMDILVRDDRAKATGGWVFGTFVYNGFQNKPTLWDNLVPVGLQWGNDPTVTSQQPGGINPAVTWINPDLRETIINPDSKKLPAQHLGFGGRLAGPVDNKMSSCQSCHSTGEFPQVSSMVPSGVGKDGSALKPGGPGWMHWFRNIPHGEAFDSDAWTTDSSLQSAGGLQNFLTARTAATAGSYAVQFPSGKPVQAIRRDGSDAADDNK